MILLQKFCRGNFLFFRIIFALLIALLLGGCNQKPASSEIRIATNAWIGYAPLFMANEKGLLQKEGFRLLHNVSLAEAMEVFSVGKAHMVTTTQHEYFALRKEVPLKPVILLDRSDGGDMILSNVTVEELKKAPHIDVYLELDSINNELLRSFAKKEGLDIHKMHFLDMDQKQIQQSVNPGQIPMLVVTYSPYHKALIKKGLHIVASTKDLDSIVVIDALCARTDIIAKERPRIKKLKIIIDSMIGTIEQNPKEAYRLCKNYLQDLAYEDFLKSLKLIRWINHPDTKILQVIEEIGYDTSELVK